MIVSEYLTRTFIRDIFTEFIGTFFLLYINFNSIANNDDTDLINISMTFGLSVSSLVYCFGNMSGCHINPAVSISLLLSERITLIRTIYYIIAQLLGGTLGVYSVKLLNSHNYDALTNGAINYIKEDYTYLQGLISEFIMSSLLCLSILILTEKKHNLGNLSIAVGFTIFSCIETLLPITNASVNPARSFSASLIANNWTDQEVFWIAPIAGSINASIFYKLIKEKSASIIGRA